MEDLKDKVAVITGGGGGIAYGIALACAREGMKMVLADVREDGLQENTSKLVKETGAEVITVICDVTSENDIKQLAQKTLDKYGRVDFMFNNAGIHFHKSFEYLTIEDWDWILKVNLWSVIYGMQVFIPIMEKQNEGGYIVNTGSGASVVAPPSMSHYAATKHAVKAITEAVMSEHLIKNSKVRIAVVMPDFVSSNLMNSAHELRPEQMNAENMKQTEIDKQLEAMFNAAVTHGQVELGVISAEQAGQVVMDGLKNDKNFIFTHETGTKMQVPSKLEQLLNGKIILDQA